MLTRALSTAPRGTKLKQVSDQSVQHVATKKQKVTRLEYLPCEKNEGRIHGKRRENCAMNNITVWNSRLSTLILLKYNSTNFLSGIIGISYCPLCSPSLNLQPKCAMVSTVKLKHFGAFILAATVLLLLMAFYMRYVFHGTRGQRRDRQM